MHSFFQVAINGNEKVIMIRSEETSDGDNHHLACHPGTLLSEDISSHYRLDMPGGPSLCAPLTGCLAFISQASWGMFASLPPSVQASQRQWRKASAPSPFIDIKSHMRC